VNIVIFSLLLINKLIITSKLAKLKINQLVFESRIINDFTNKIYAKTICETAKAYYTQIDTFSYNSNNLNGERSLKDHISKSKYRYKSIATLIAYIFSEQQNTNLIAGNVVSLVSALKLPNRNKETEESLKKCRLFIEKIINQCINIKNHNNGFLTSSKLIEIGYYTDEDNDERLYWQINIDKIKNAFNPKKLQNINENSEIIHTSYLTTQFAENKNIDTTSENFKVEGLSRQKSKYYEIEKQNSFISEIVASWGFTDLNKEKHILNVKNWLNNFEEVEIPIVAKLLPKIRLERDIDINEKIEFLCANLIEEFGSRIKTCYFYLLEENYSFNDNNLLFKIKKELGLNDWNFPREIQDEKYTINIFVDYILGFGNEVINYYNTNLKDLKSQNYYCSLYGFRKGILNIQDSTNFVEVIVSEKIVESDRFENLQLDKECLSIVEKYGRLLFPNHPLGYDDSQSLICFLKECPKNTLPIIWAEKGNESVKEINWHPLFKRRKPQKLRDDIPLFVIKDMFQINQFKKEISQKYDIQANQISDTQSLIKFVNSRVFIYEYEKKESWYKCEDILPITEKIANYSIAQGLVSKELVKLLSDIGRLNKHRNRVEKAYAYFALGSQTLNQLKQDLNIIDFNRLKYQINHYNIQRNISLAEEQDELCKYSDSALSKFNNAKCQACVFTKRNNLGKAKQYLHKCIDELDELEHLKSAYILEDGVLKKSKNFKYSLANFFRVATQFYIKTNNFELAKNYSLKSLEIFSELNDLNNFAISVNYYHLYVINKAIGNKLEARKYFGLCKESRRNSLLLTNCLVDISKIDKDLGLK